MAFRPTDPFPAGTQVAVLNKNDFEVELMWDSVVYSFKPGEPNVVPSDVAFALFVYDTRPGHQYIRDKGFGRTSTHPGLYESRLVSMGWANNPALREAFDRFEFVPVNQGGRMSVADFERLKKNQPAPNL
jgi:hypothetical protein